MAVILSTQIFSSADLQNFLRSKNSNNSCDFCPANGAVYKRFGTHAAASQVCYGVKGIKG